MASKTGYVNRLYPLSIAYTPQTVTRQRNCWKVLKKVNILLMSTCVSFKKISHKHRPTFKKINKYFMKRKFFLLFFFCVKMDPHTARVHKLCDSFYLEEIRSFIEKKKKLNYVFFCLYPYPFASDKTAIMYKVFFLSDELCRNSPMGSRCFEEVFFGRMIFRKMKFFKETNRKCKFTTS